MPESADTPLPDDAAPPTNLGGVDAGELLARGMHTVKMSSAGAHGWEPPALAEVAALFPTYEILSMLGRGGMGAVYKARQIALDRFVAIKLLPLEISVDQAFVDRFRREARAMAKLNHPHIISVFDFGQTAEGHLFFVMEFVEGANLAEIIHQVGLAPDQALALAGQVCTALAYAHGKGVVHRDIKPANVMVDAESQVKVADFGLARLTDPTAETYGTTVTGTVMGTPDYMAPEQTRGMNVDHRADIYSLGVMLYEMLCRETPRGAFDLPSARTGCDPRLDAIVMKAMQPAPERRYQSTHEMKADVDSARTPVKLPPPVAEPAVSAPPRVVEKADAFVPKKNRPPLWITSAVALVVVLGAVGYWVKHRGAPIAAASGGSTPTDTAVWKPVVLTQEEVAKQEGSSLSANGELNATKPFILPGITARDIVLRAETRVLPAAQHPGIILRHIDGRATRLLAIDSTRTMLQLYEPNGTYPVLFSWDFPPEKEIEGKWVPFQFATVGNLSIGELQSRMFTATSEKALQSGVVKFAGHVQLRKIEVMILDGVPEAQWPEFIRTAMMQAGIAAPATESSFATATKDAPFVDTLGMKFVPVPITGGPSGGQRVLFSVWDTRVQDYAVFARENKVDDAWTKQEEDGVPVSRGADYPVVGLPWNDAKAFCQWLTKKESAEGKLPTGMAYRLPTDEEWSCAVGLAKEAGATPKERDMKNTVDYPWGSSFPPTAKAGNYADETRHGKFPSKPYIDGYTDGYATTSPVGSFAPNKYGLYDMGGNVWQWCDDPYVTGNADDHVMRGAAWYIHDRNVLLSSYRIDTTSWNRFYKVGFRCVLAPAAASK